MGKNDKNPNAEGPRWWQMPDQPADKDAALSITDEWVAHAYAAAAGGAKAEQAVKFADHMMVAKAMRIAGLMAPRAVAQDALDTLPGSEGDGPPGAGTAES